MLRIAVLALGLSLALGTSLTGLSLAEDEETTVTEEVSEAEETEEVTQEDLLETMGTVHGKRGRRNFKTAYWAAGLTGDMKNAYETYGYPSGRYREQKMGRVEETWTYMELGRQFTFRDGKLVRERSFRRGSASSYPLK